LIVKEFERMTATEATLFVDQGATGHCGFGAVSTLEAMREAAVGLGRTLLAQQVGVQLVAADRRLDMGTGAHQSDALVEVVRGLGLRHGTSYAKLVEEHLPLVAPGSVALLLVCSGNVSLADLLGSLMALEDRRVETQLIVFDSRGYERRTRAEAGLDADSFAAVMRALLQDLPLQERLTGADLEATLRRLAQRTYVVGPDRSLAEVLAA
jgi:uncharacterized protein (DUF58 family)